MLRATPITHTEPLGSGKHFDTERSEVISLRFANGFENGSLQTKAARHGRKLSPAAPIGALLRESPRPRGLAWGRNYRHPYHIAKGPVQPCGDLYTGDRKPWESHVGSAFRPLPHSFTGRKDFRCVDRRGRGGGVVNEEQRQDGG